jgi:putative endopeptidase
MRTLLILLAASTAMAACTTAGTTTDAEVAAQTETVSQAAVGPVAPAPANRPQIGSFGFDMAGMDRSVSPGQNFYQFANGTWLKTTQIPPDKSNYGMFTVLDDLSRQRTQEILEDARKDGSSKVGNAYASYLDQAAVEARGLKPIQPWLAQIKGLKSKAAYPALVAQAQRNGVGGPVVAFVGQDDKNPEVYAVSMVQAGLGMPDRDYYLSADAKMAQTRAAYLAHLEKMFTLAGEPNAAARAKALLAFETDIARVHWTRVESRDATKTYNKLAVADLERTAPGFDFSSYFDALGARGIDSVIVAQPSAVKGIAGLIARAPISTLKDQLLIRSLDNLSDYLPDAISNENFAFYGTVLSGTPQREARWKRAVNFTTGALGEEVGKAYVAKYFPPETKAAADTLVKNVLAAMDRRIDSLTWMVPETKAKAKAKVAAFTPKIGYPERWRDYGGLEVRRDDLFGNAIRSNNFDHAYNFGKLGKPIYRWEWGMTPMTINAYANFGMVEIVFPAAILQPPFFDPNADPAVNYGGIGAVIGHEISHHFDDQGAKYNAEGRLSDWWTPADVRNFEAFQKVLGAQYDQYEPLPGLKVQGNLTMGENIGDLAGLTVAYDAYKDSLGGRQAPVIDGFTGDQRFFLGWAQVWRRNYREANLRQRLLTDPHSPSEQRVAVVRNMDPWYSAFNVRQGEMLYLPAQQRVKIW